MRTVNLLVLIIAYSLVSGCDTREPEAVGSLAAPDGRHVLRVMNEYGGLRSGVVSIHLTRPGEQTTPQNEVLRTPECTRAAAGWADRATVLIVYDSLYAGGFHSDLPRDGLRVTLVDRRRASDAQSRLANSISLPCDPL